MRAAARASSRMGRSTRAAIPWDKVGILAAAFVPAALTVYFCFQKGAFFPGATAVGVLVLIVLLIGRVALAKEPFAGFSPLLGVAVGAMALLAVWMLASTGWSDSSARAMIEFDRALLYLLALVLFGSLPRQAGTLRWMLRGVALAMVFVCVVAFVTRTLPDVWSVPAGLQSQRLNYPLGYWNALGLLAALALVFCLHLTCSAREPRPVHLTAAAATPVVASTLLLTFSRASLVAAALGLVTYLVVGRPKLALTGLLASVPATAFAVVTAYNANFASDFVKGQGYSPLTAAGAAEARDLAITVAACAGVALLIRALGMLVLDRELARVRLSRRVRRGLALAGAGLASLALVVGVVQATHGGWLDEQADRLGDDSPLQTGDYRDRLSNPGLGRVALWRVAMDAFQEQPLHGTGAGTYRLVWERHRRTQTNSTDAHSLYLETLAELGLVGTALLVVALLAIIGGVAWRVRGTQRAVYAALLSGAVVWVAHAAVDRGFEIPGVTIWMFAAGGLALSRPAPETAARRIGWPVRAVLLTGLLLLAIAPARLALSQHHLGKSGQAYRDGRCAEAISQARSSISVLGNRPEPYQLEAYCLARTDPVRASRVIGQAVRLDPSYWRYHHALSLMQALAGLDPRQEARKALVRNPRAPRARTAVERFRESPRSMWMREARRLGFGRPSRYRASLIPPSSRPKPLARFGNEARLGIESERRGHATLAAR